MKIHDILKIRQTLFENVDYLLDKITSYNFPHNINLILISSYEKTLAQAILKLKAVRQELIYLKENSLPELSKASQPYEAKMLIIK